MTRGFSFPNPMAPLLSKSLRTGVSGVIPASKGRLVLLAIGLLACVWGLWSSGREGLSQLLAGNSLMSNQLEGADRAVRINPELPEAHYVRATLLYDRNELGEAIKEYERAVALRPHDYALWIELGRARDQANDLAGALAAFAESTRLAPFYTEPHWQLGNVLFRSGRRAEAIAEFRRAVDSNPQLLPQAMNFTWRVFGGDASAFQEALQPKTQYAHMALASFFAAHGKPTESIAQFRAAGVISNEQRRVLLADLLNSKSFPEAFEVWSSGRTTSGENDRHGLAGVANGGFEDPIPLDEPGFGWQLARNLPSVRASLDPSEPHAGSVSLRLDWSGESNPATPIISQLVLVEPKTSYRLSFAVRTREMLTIGLPVITVTDASGDNVAPLIQSESFARGTSGWQNYAMEFATTETTQAVLIVIRRQNCAIAPCIALGHAWVDDFSLAKM
jgi:tetratricopeptide (TPR) repeat protein